MSAVDQLAQASQAQYQRYCELFGAHPIDGQGMRELATHLHGVTQHVNDTRNQVMRLRFSTTVLPSYAAATREDPTPFEHAAHFASTTATVTDDSARVNLDGARSIAATAQAEASQIAAVPDPDSPEGHAQIVAIITRHQHHAAAIVADSAAAEQSLGERAAAAAQGSPQQHSAAPSPEDRITEPKTNHVQLVDDHTHTPTPPPDVPLGAQPQIGPFPVPPQVAAAAPPLHPHDPLSTLLLPNTAPRLAPSDPLTDVLRHLGSPDPTGPLGPEQIKQLVDADVQNKLDDAQRFSLNALLGKTLEGCSFGGITAGVGGLITGPLEPIDIAGGCIVGAIGDGGKYIYDSK
jgi:hypothetical protein